MATTRSGTRTKAKAKPAPEPEEVEDDDLELDEVEEDEVEDTPAPKGKAKSKKADDEVVFGASDLAKHITETTGKPVDARNLRTLIRKMARDGSGRVTREIVAGNRSRYNWSGPDDPEVKAIIKAFKAGELDADKAEKLAKLKENKAAKDAAAKKLAETGTTGKKGKAKAKPAPVEEDDDEDLELDEDDD